MKKRNFRNLEEKIIVTDNTKHVYIFDSLEAAAASIEVEDCDLYTIYDTKGRVYKPTLKKVNLKMKLWFITINYTQEIVELIPTDEYRLQGLIDILQGWLISFNIPGEDIVNLGIRALLIMSILI